MEVVDRVADHYIVLNADTLAGSTILGFGHRTGTYEVTFFHDIPLEWVVSCNDTPRAQLGIMSPDDVRNLPKNNDEDRWAHKLLRPPD